MSQIDNRIVILTFDNKDFDKRVQQSTESLDKLKKGLNLKDSAKNLDAVSESSKRFNLNGITDAVEGAKYRFSTLGIVGATVVSELTKTAMGLGSKLLSAISSPLTSGGWKRALNIEQAKFQLEGLGIAWDKVKDDINYGVKDTAYGLDVAAKAAAQLSASGIQLGTDMKAALRGISGVAAMSGSSYEEISQIFARVAGANRVFATDLNSIAARGLNAAAELGKALGKTEYEVREMVRKGEIDFQTFANAMDNAFGEHAKEANKTFSGAMSNVKAALSRIGADVAANSLTNFRDIFNSLIPLIDNVHTALGPFIERLNAGMTKATQGLVKFINFLNSRTPTAKKNATEVGNAMDFMASRGVNAVPKLAEAFETTEEEIVNMAKGGRISLDKFSSVMEEKFGKEFPEVVNEFKDNVSEMGKEVSGTMKTTGQTILGNIGNAFKNIGNFFATIGKSIGSAFKEVFSGAFTSDAKRLSGNLKDLSDKFVLNKNGANGLKVAFKGLFNVFKYIAKGIGWIVTGFIKFITIIAGAIRKVIEFGGKLAKSFEESGRKAKLMEALGIVISKIGEILVAFKNKLVEFGRAIKNSEGFKKLAEAFKLLWGAIKNFFGRVFDRFISKLKEFGKFKPNFSWTNKLVEFLSKAMGKLADFIIALVNGEHPIRNFFANISQTDKPLGKFIGFLGKIKDAIVNFFKKGISIGSGNGEKNLLGSIKDFFVGGFEKLKEADIIGNIVKVFKGIGEKLKEVDWKDVAKKAFEISKVIIAFRYVQSLIRLNNNLGFNINLDIVGAARQLAKRDFSQKIRDLGIGLALLSATLLILSKIPTESLKKSVAALSVVLGELVLVYIAVEKLGKGNAFAKFAASITLFSVGMFILAGAMKLFSVMKPETLLKGGGAIVGLVTLLAIAARIAGKTSFGTFFGMALAVAVLVPAIGILGKFKPKTLIKGASAIFSIVMMLSLASRLAGKSSFGTFFGMALAVGILIPAIAILGKMKTSTLLKGGFAILGVVTVLALASRLAGRSSMGSMLSMALTVGAVTIALAALSQMNAGKLIASATALSSVIYIISTALSKIGNVKGKAGAVASLVIILASITAAFKILGDMNPLSVLASAAGIGIVALALTSSLAIMAKLQIGIKNTIGAVISLSILLYAIVGAFHLMKSIPTETALAIAESLSVTVLALTGALTVLSFIPVSAALSAAISFGVFVGVLTGVLIALGAITKIPGVEDLVDKGGGLLGKIGGAIGNFVGSIVAGFGSAVSSAMPGIAENLSDFAEKIKPFLSMKIDEQNINSVKNIVAIIMSMSGATMMDGISRIFSFGQDPYDRVGKSLVIFAKHINKFSKELMKGDISVATIAASTSAATMLVEFYGKAKSIMGGAISQLFEGSPLLKFAQGLLEFADPLTKYVNKIKSSGIQPGDIIPSTMAATLLVEFYGKVKDTVSGGGFAQIFEGNPLLKFAQGLLEFADPITHYINKIKASGIQPADVIPSTMAATLLVDFYGKVKDVVSGGGISRFFEGSPLLKFALEMVSFSDPLIKYVNKIKAAGIQPSDIIPSTAAASILLHFYQKVKDIVSGGISGLWDVSPLTKFASELASFAPSLSTYVKEMRKAKITASDVMPSTMAATILVSFYDKIKDVVKAGLSSIFSGSPLQKFGEELALFGPYLNVYYGSVSTIKGDILQKINTAVVSFLPMVISINTISTDKIGSFGQNLSSFGSDIGAYAIKVNRVDPNHIIKTINIVYKLIEMVKKMAFVNTNAMANFGNALKTCADRGIREFINAFKNAEPQAKEAARKLIENAKSGIESGPGSGAWKTVAFNTVQGLIDGLNNKTKQDAVYNAGYQLGLQAYKGVKKGLAIKSPSRRMYEAGMYSGQGLLNALIQFMPKIYDAGKAMGQTVLDAIANPISRIQSLLNDEMDLTPKITPVLDFNSINSDIGLLNGMFGRQNIYPNGLSSLQSYNNVNGIQNIANDMKNSANNNQDIVNAIGSMREDIINLGDRMAQMQVLLDGKKLVGEIINPIDMALGARADLAERRVY